MLQRGVEQQDVDNQSRAESLVNEHVGHMFEDYENILDQEILLPLEEIRNQETSFDPEKLRLGLDTLKQALYHELESNPRFWQTYDGKLQFSDSLDEKVNHFWARYGAPIEAKEKQLASELGEMNAELQEFAAEQEKLTDLKAKLEERLDQIEFPFGKIPIGFAEAISVFPLGLVLVFLLCNAMLRDSIRLRQSYHQAVQSQSPEPEEEISKHVALVAPLWLDPLASGLSRTLNFAIYVTPFLIFIISCALIIKSWTIPGDEIAIGQLPPWLYAVLYLCSGALFLFGYWQIALALSNYSANVKFTGKVN
jgi:hypothetical protein